MTIGTDELRALAEDAIAGRCVAMDSPLLNPETMLNLVDEIDRLRGMLGGRTMSCSQCETITAERDRLRALLAEARECEGLQNWYGGGGDGGDDNLLARIDAVLGEDR